MTDQQNYHDADGLIDLTLRRYGGNGVLVSLDAAAQPDSVHLAMPTETLLAMIDRLHPEAMRDYLRETTDATGAEIEAESAWHGDPDEDDGTTLPCPVPEADSPEDVDEQPDPVEQMRESGRQLGEAWRALADAFRDASKR